VERERGGVLLGPLAPLMGSGGQVYGSNLRVDTLGSSERASGYSETPKLLTPEGAAARLRGVGIAKSAMGKRVCCAGIQCIASATPSSGFAYTSRSKLQVLQYCG
jgi:hypothetical protein